jgi:hypothetical protein
VNVFRNLAGVVGGHPYRYKYAQEYRLPFYIMLGSVATALLGYTSYRFTLQAVNKGGSNIRIRRDAEQIETERTDDISYANRKWAFIYGL